MNEREDKEQAEVKPASVDANFRQNRGSSRDPVQRAAREERIKQNLRENLRRRKQKARAIKQREEN